MFLLIFEYFGVEPLLIVLVALAPRLDRMAGRKGPFTFCLMRVSIVQHHNEGRAYIFHKPLV
jgi:hypothetical protein